MKIKELDVVELKNGQCGTVLEVFDQGEAYLVEVVDKSGKTVDMPTVKADDIKQVTWANT
jgi:ribosomal 30S subunit maturation factor RimM